MSRFLDQLSLILFVAILAVVSMFYGIWAVKNAQFPAPELERAIELTEQWLSERERNEMVDFEPRGPLVKSYLPNNIAPGLVAVSGMTDGPVNFVRVIDREGRRIHEWRPDWFEIWGDSGSFPADKRPKSRPGTILHGFRILDDGSLVFNFEYLSTVRVSACGQVIWRLENSGHHSIETDDEGNLWVPAQTVYRDEGPPFPGHRTPLRSDSVQKISRQGKILETVEVIEIVLRNDLPGLLYFSDGVNDPRISGDPVHLNDIEIFPSHLPPGAFDRGDVMLSLRNTNSILVLDPDLQKVKHTVIGPFVRQHDPDFMTGDRISVFDNRNLGDAPGSGQSRILEIAVPADGKSVVQIDDAAGAFYTNIMGKHERLANGNVMIVSSKQARVLEVDDRGRLVWEYNNLLAGKRAGLVTQAEVLPAHMNTDWFQRIGADCRK